MKQRIAIVCIAIVFVLSLAGCQASEETIYTEYTKLLQGPPSSENLRDVAVYLDENIGDVRQEMATRMVKDYEDHLIHYIKENPDKSKLSELIIYFDKETGIIDVEKMEGSCCEAYYEAINRTALVFRMQKEELVLSLNYEEIIEKYGSYIDEPVILLYELAERIAQDPITIDAALNVSYETLLSRALEAENLLITYPEVDFQEDVMWIYTAHINAILMGATNTPIFDYNTHQFSKEANEAYVAFLKENQETTLTWVMKEYYTYLNSIGFQLDYSDKSASKVYFETCDWLVSEAEKRVLK